MLKYAKCPPALKRKQQTAFMTTVNDQNDVHHLHLNDNTYNTQNTQDTQKSTSTASTPAGRPHFVSLGPNCSIRYQLNKLQPPSATYYFDWLLTERVSSIADVLEHGMDLEWVYIRKQVNSRDSICSRLQLATLPVYSLHDAPFPCTNEHLTKVRNTYRRRLTRFIALIHATSDRRPIVLLRKSFISFHEFKRIQNALERHGISSTKYVVVSIVSFTVCFPAERSCMFTRETGFVYVDTDRFVFPEDVLDAGRIQNGRALNEYISPDADWRQNHINWAALYDALLDWISHIPAGSTSVSRYAVQ